MKRQKAVRKGRKRYVNKLCESFLNKETKVRTMDASSASNSDSSAANATIRSTTLAVGAIIKSSDVYFYGVDVIALLAISVCGFFFFFASYQKSSQTSNKKQANKQQPPKNLSNRRSTV